jgi:hypothetical protein
MTWTCAIGSIWKLLGCTLTASANQQNDGMDATDTLALKSENKSSATALSPETSAA